MTAQYVKPDRLKAEVDAALNRLRGDRAVGRFPLVETIREEVRRAGLDPAGEAELRELDGCLAEALANNAIEGVEPDPELVAMLAMLREERLSPRYFDRFYERYVSEWTRAIRQ
jgi:hypothetical protein